MIRLTAKQARALVAASERLPVDAHQLGRACDTSPELAARTASTLVSAGLLERVIATDPPRGRRIAYRSACQWRCYRCGKIFAAFAPAQRHADASGHRRIEVLLDVTVADDAT